MMRSRSCMRASSMVMVTRCMRSRQIGVGRIVASDGRGGGTQTADPPRQRTIWAGRLETDAGVDGGARADRNARRRGLNPPIGTGGLLFLEIAALGGRIPVGRRASQTGSPKKAA